MKLFFSSNKKSNYFKIKVFCSLTSSFHAKSSTSTNSPTTSASNETTNIKEDESINNGEASNSEKSKNSKYFSDIGSLYILGKHYPTPIGIQT